MKKLDKSISTDLDALVIYEEELRELFTLLNENCKGVRLKVDNLQFDNVDELVKHFAPNRIKQLEISTVEPYISIELYNLRARIYAGSSAPAVEGLYHKCKTILRRRSKIYGILCSFRIFWTYLIIETIFGSIVKGEWSPYLKAVFFPYGCWIFFVRMTRHSLIYARKSDSVESFWLRNKDTLIVEAIVGLVGFVLGVIVQHYIQILK